MNTTENNKLIAEFMGVIPTSTKHTKNWYDGQELSAAGLPFSCGAMGNGTSELKFATSWDWLMPCIEKISRFKYEDKGGNLDYAYPRTFGMTDDEGNYMVRINRMPLNSDESLITATYQAVTEFIKWYNKQKKEDHGQDTLFCKDHPEVEVLPDEEGNCSACGGDCNEQVSDDKRHKFYRDIESFLINKHGWTQGECEERADLDCYDQYLGTHTPREAVINIISSN